MAIYDLSDYVTYTSYDVYLCNPIEGYGEKFVARPSLGLNRPPPNIIVTTIAQTTVSQDRMKNEIDGM